MIRKIRFGLLLNQAEKVALGRLAEAEGGLSHAATLRRLIRQAAHQRGLWLPKRPQSDEDAQG